MTHQMKKLGWFSVRAMVMMIAVAFLLLSCSTSGPGPKPEASLGTLVTTQYGQIQGAEDENNTWVWKGIPFAQAPVGDLRWRAPADPTSRDDVLEANEFSVVCPQYVQQKNFSYVMAGNEDCLFIREFPRVADFGPLPSPMRMRKLKSLSMLCYRPTV